MKTALRGAAVLSVLALVVAGCGGGGSSSSKKTAGAPKVSGATGKPTGTIHMCIGKDTSGIHTKLVNQFNAANPGAKASLIELPESADQQRTQMVQRQRAKSPECDLLALDVVWTAEFASQGWLQDMTSVVDKRKSEFIPSTLESATYQGKVWAMPYNTNAGLLFYRKDKVPAAPKSWEEAYADGKKTGGLVYQGAQYEGLTVNYLEMLYSGGGKVLSDDGKSSAIDSPEARKALQFMVDGIKSGAVPKAVTTMQEEDARRAFESGAASLERNWPYVYGLALKAPKIKGKFAYEPFPSFAGKPGAGVLGGYNLAVSAYTKNQAGAVALINYLTGNAAQIEAGKVATPPVVASAYDDPGVQKAMPFATDLKKAIEQAKSRPVSPVYPQISEAIYKNAHSALTGQSSVDAAIKAMDAGIKKALATF
jgi:multiple sugar transport system substrate-binding protein